MEGLKGSSLLLLVILCVMLMVVTGAEDAEGATITVPDDYPTINSAIENATDYDTLFIKDGTYNEAVVVWRPLTIIGESQAGTIIENEDPFAVLMVANRVSLSSVTVQGTTVGAGLILQASNCVIEDVTVRDCLWGLWVNRGYHNVVRNVQCLNNSWQGLLVEEADDTILDGVTCKGNNEGIHVRAAVGTTIKDCTMADNRANGLLVNDLMDTYETEDVKVLSCMVSNNSANGMEFADTDHVTVEDCKVEDSAWSAIRFDRCDDVTVRGCEVRNFVRLGLAFQGDGTTQECLIEENFIMDEGTAWSKITVHGVNDCIIRNNYVKALSSAISVLYANDTLVSDNELVSTNDNASIETVGIIVGRHRAGVLLPPTNVTLLRNEVSGYTEGIRVRGGWDIDIIDCTVRDAEVGIAFAVFDYGDDPIVGGVVKGCTFDGCGLVSEGMLDITVEDNLIMGAEVGMYFNATSHQIKDNVFMRNTIMDCSGYGLSWSGTNGTNMFHTNTFINNTEHSSTPFSDDVFNSFMYGNYWDDYEERYPDATIDGRVWDTPYGVGGSNVMDMYPLAFAYDTQAPVADAGEHQGGETGSIYLLNGTGSWDNGVIVRYTWTFTYADTLTELEGETTTFPFLLIGSYPVTLEVEDAWGNTDTDTTMVHIHDLTDPNANAGDDIEVGMGVEFMFDGSASTDNGLIVTYEWHVDPGGLDRVVEGEMAMFTIDGPGEYPVVLKVIDEAGNWAINDMLVTVLDTEDPVADAGRDFFADQGEEVTLFGGWSRDNVDVFSWTWIFTEDGEVVIEVGQTVDREFPFPGVYTIMLNVSDAAGNWDVDELMLTVRDTEPPVADAGTDIQVDQGTLVTLDGTGSTDNVAVVGFNWLFAEGSAIKNLLGAGASYRFDIPGDYELELQAWDAAGNIGLDWVIVTVNADPTIKPWWIGPFRDDDGVLGGVRVELVLDGIAFVEYTDDDGNAIFIVPVEFMISPTDVLATKEGWKDLAFEMEYDANGDIIGSIPLMKRVEGTGDDDDDDDEDETDWLAWGLVIVLIIAYSGTLLYLSSAAKRAEED